MKKFGWALLAVVIIAVGVGAGYYYVEVINKDKTEKKPTTEKKKEEKEQIRTWKREEVSELLTPVLKHFTPFSPGEKELEITQLSDEKIFKFCLFQLWNTDEKKQEFVDLAQDGEVMAIPSSRVKELALKYFNRKDFVYKEDAGFHYDSKRDSYYATETFGYTGGPELIPTITDMKQTGTVITVNIKSTYDTNNSLTKNDTEFHYIVTLESDNNRIWVTKIVQE